MISSFSFERTAVFCSVTTILLSRITPDLSLGIMVKLGIQGIAYSLKAFPISWVHRSSYFSISSVAITLNVVLSPALLDGLLSILELTERRYLELEDRINREVEIPDEAYAVYMTVVKKEDYDPINGTLFPVCPEFTDGEIGGNGGGGMSRIVYFSGPLHERQSFEAAENIYGYNKDGECCLLKVRKAACCRRAIEDLYQVFVCNRIRWTTVNTGYLDRFYEVYAVGGGDIREWKIDFGCWEDRIKEGMVPLWNIEKFVFQCRKFMIPCIDEKHYEHELDLKEYGTDSAYMVGRNDDILHVRHEKNKIIMTSFKESFQDWEGYRFSCKIDVKSHGYNNEILSNARKNSFFQNYLERQGTFLDSRMELFRLVESFEDDSGVVLERCDVTEQKPPMYLEGDMNPFHGETAFPMDTRKLLVLRFRKKGDGKEFCEDMVRFFVSQIQLSICEYKCIGILE